MIGEDQDDNSGRVAAPGAKSSGSGAARPRRHSVRELMGDQGEAVLVHMDQEYRLRITSNGKLILTK
jgi:hemin uptake protein HemP